MTYEAQQARELLVGQFLSVNAGAWRDWVFEVGDDAIPAELHQHVANVITGLGMAAQDRSQYQTYLQALCLLSDESLRWLVEAVWPYQEKLYGGDSGELKE